MDAITLTPTMPPPPGDGMRPPDRTGSVLGISRRGFHRIAYVEWGDPAAARTAICVHGLSRQGRDFDVLAAALADRGWRVICPDLVGRGRSDWLRDPEEYNLPQYAMDMTTIIAHLGVTRVDWIGTSLGGLIGITLAGQPNTPIGRLVINDIGPFLPWQALNRLATNVRNAPRLFADFAAGEQHYRTTLAPFGALTDAQWRHMTLHSVEPQPDGTWRRRCDDDITAAFRPGLFFNLSLWTYWDAIVAPTLVLRGVLSDLLLPTTAHDMQRRGPKAELHEIADVGHCPALLSADQVAIVIDWLETNPPV